jgi:hypothetical protein
MDYYFYSNPRFFVQLNYLNRIGLMRGLLRECGAAVLPPPFQFLAKIDLVDGLISATSNINAENIL